jgi:hypothetical protein
MLPNVYTKVLRKIKDHKGIIGIPIKILLLPASSFRDRELL